MIDFNARAIWLPVKNTTGETIPGCALMEVVANPPTDNGQDVDGNWLVRKPTIDGNTRVIVNSEAEIPVGETGRGHRENHAVLLYDTTEDLPLINDQYGTAAGSWQAHKDKAGFRIDHAGNGRANAQRESGGGAAATSSEVLVTGSLVTGPLDYYPGTLETTTTGTSWTSGASVRIVNTGATALVNGQRYTASYIGTVSGNAYYATRDNDSASGFSTVTAQYLTDATIACVAGTVTITLTKDSSRNYMVM